MPDSTSSPDHGRPRRRPRRRLPRITAVLATASLALGAMLAANPAQALPPGGAQPSTPGTKSTVSPKTVKPGQRVNFTLSGYPGGETVYVKFDDGASSEGDQSVQGQGVVHQQKIPAGGTVRGSVVVPTDMANGSHWFRFLASENVPGKGSKGYTNHSPNFTVTGSSNTTGKKSKSGHYANVGNGDGGTTTKKRVVKKGSKGSGANADGGEQAGSNSGAVPGQAGKAGQAGGGTVDDTTAKELNKQNTILTGELQKRDTAFPWMGIIAIFLALMAVVTLAVAILGRTTAPAGGPGKDEGPDLPAQPGPTDLP